MCSICAYRDNLLKVCENIDRKETNAIDGNVPICYKNQLPSYSTGDWCFHDIYIIIVLKFYNVKKTVNWSASIKHPRD